MKELTRIVVVGLVVSVGVVSSAQSQQLERRFFVSLDGGFQSGQQQFQDRRTTADVYGEDQITDTDYDIDRSAGLLRVNVTARLRESIGFGFGFTRSVSTGNADVTVAVPSPLFVNRPRVVSTDLSTLGHRENMYHFQAAAGRTYVLAGPQYTTLNELVALIATELGVRPPRWHFPVWPVWLLGALCEGVCVPLRIEPPLYRRRVEFFTKSRAFDTTRAKAEIGWATKIDLRTGLSRTAAWYKQQGLL